MPPFRWARDALAAQRGHLFHWVPVSLACGIGTYFALPVEPGGAEWLGVALCMAVLLALTLLAGEAFSVLSLGCLLGLAGFGLAGARAHLVAAPVLEYRYYGPVQGRVVGIDRSVSDKLRLTLDRVVLSDLSPANTPTRVRVSLHGDQRWIDPAPGMVVILTGHLSPPQGPVEPGGFDFRRLAWFDGLGAVGYTRTPVLIWEEPKISPQLWVFALRMRISEAVRAHLPGSRGAFVAAILTGDRSAITQDIQEALRASNLAHLLAISGLHMGLLTGVVFGAMRLGLALVPPLALRLQVKKIAALSAIGAGAFYLLLSGGNVATERAFVMVAVMFGAVLFDRRAISLRAVATAAIIVLMLRPEQLLGPGFQMSFAATVALVAVFRGLQRWRDVPLPRVLRPVLAVVLSSAVAGAATAPVAAAHFNRIAVYGLVANLASVPLMGLVVMPAAVLAAVLEPFGLGWIGLEIMAPAVGWILSVAEHVAGLEGAVRPVVAPPSSALPLFAGGMLWLILWQGKIRLAGCAPVLLAAVLWTTEQRPLLLISHGGGLVGSLTPEGRALSKPRGDGFAARVWLENDGELASQDGANARWTGPVMIGGLAFHHVTGRRAEEFLPSICRPGTAIVTNQPIEWTGPCILLDARVLERTGAVAIKVTDAATRVETASATAGPRLWAGSLATSEPKEIRALRAALPVENAPTPDQ
ncbi:MAG: ComEC/Rec2 family competence protein [Rhodobacteraceae bacterium]|nr:ComEC/Rec2 family competence protein [Paracoccaceae bacterium]